MRIDITPGRFREAERAAAKRLGLMDVPAIHPRVLRALGNYHLQTRLGGNRSGAILIAFFSKMRQFPVFPGDNGGDKGELPAWASHVPIDY